MKKPSNFTSAIYIDWIDDENDKFTLLQKICQEQAFRIDYDCGNMFISGSDLIYELLESRMIFILKSLKKEEVVVNRYTIEAYVFDSKIHGSLI